MKTTPIAHIAFSFLLLASSYAQAANYYQFTNRWIGEAITADDASENVKYGSSEQGNKASHWEMIPVPNASGYFRLRNRESGRVAHIEPLNGTVKIEDISQGAWSSHWRLERTGSFVRLVNRWRPNERMHVEDRSGTVQHNVVPDEFWSAQWNMKRIEETPPPNNTNPHVNGAWSEVANWPLVAIHAALTADGKVMTYGTDQNGIQGGQYIYDIWNPKLGLGADAHTTLPNGTGTDIFCSAQALIPGTSEILLTGGDIRGEQPGSYNQGVDDVNLFNSETNTLSAQAPMNKARWYPTITTLPNGNILLQGGIDRAGASVTTPEIYDINSKTWRELSMTNGAAIYSGNGWWYPRSWVSPRGDLFGLTNGKMYKLDPSDNGSANVIGNMQGSSKNYTSTAVMFRPGRILQIAGGVNSATSQTVNASDQVTEYNIQSETPMITQRPNIQYPRHWANATVLPDGKVLVTGGSAAANVLKGVATAAEIYDPDTNSWTTGAQAVEERLYHSVGLLLPDASVLVAGGGAPAPRDAQNNPTTSNLNAEIYYPPYFFDEYDNKRTLKTIANYPKKMVTWGENFTITLPKANEIEKIALIRAGTVTHSNNMEQRFMHLNFTNTGSNTLEVTTPRSANLAPPGYYLLFAIDTNNTPTQGVIISLGKTTSNIEYFQLTERWKNKELFSNNQGKLRYGEKSAATMASHWVKEPVAGTHYVRIKNRVTGKHIHIWPNDGIVKTGDIAANDKSAHWELRKNNAGYIQLYNRKYPRHKIHVEQQNGNAQHGVVPNGYWSSQWTLKVVQ